MGVEETMAINKTNSTFRLVESAVEVSKIPFASGQYIVNVTSGEAFYDPSSGSTVADRIALSPDLSGFLTRSIADNLVSDVQISTADGSVFKIAVTKVGTEDGASATTETFIFKSNLIESQYDDATKTLTMNVKTTSAVTQDDSTPVTSGAVWSAVESAKEALQESIDDVKESSTATVTVLNVAGSAGDEDALSTIVDPKHGDFAICKHPITSDTYEHTAYMYDASLETPTWVALDGNYSADNVIFGSDLTITANIGVQTLASGASSKTLATTGKSVKQVFNMILAQEVKPSISANPAVTTKLANNTTPGTGNVAVEGGTTITPKWSASLSPGYYKYGPATGITATSWSVTDNRKNIDSTLTNETSDTDSGTFADLVLPAGKTYKVTATATHGAGPVAYTNLGEEYKTGNALFDSTSGAAEVKITAGSKSDESPTITAWQQGYYIGTLESDVAVTSDILRNVGDGKGLLKNRFVKNANFATETIYFDGASGHKAAFSGTMAKFVVAYPASIDTNGTVSTKGLTKFFNNSSFEEYLGNFTRSTIKVAGADNDLTSAHAIDYTVCTWTPASAFSGTTKFEVTLTK